MVKSISAIVSNFAKLNEKSEVIISKQLQRVSHGFIEMSICLVDRIEQTLREDELLADTRKQYNDALLAAMLKGSNYGFSNVLKIGNIAKKNKEWLLGFNSLSALCVALAAFTSVPSCKGIAALEIMPVDKHKTVDGMVREIDNTLAVDQIRDTINTAKGIPNKEKTKDESAPKKDESTLAKPNESAPVHTAKETTALSMATVIAVKKHDKDFLLAFVRQIFNAKADKEFLAAVDEVKMSNRIPMGN